jgi:hypothetical protein
LAFSDGDAFQYHCGFHCLYHQPRSLGDCGPNVVR